MRKNNSILIITILIFVSCGSSNNNCSKALVDDWIKEWAEYNSIFYDENYTGKVISYHDENKTITKMKLHFENGQIVKYESFHENGDPKLVKPIKCNSTHGNLIFYLPDNKIAYELEHTLGKKNGIGKSYYDDGQVHRIVQFVNDKKHGEQIVLANTGDTLSVELYINGRKIE